MSKKKFKVDDLTMMEIKLEVAYESGLAERIRTVGWSGLSAKEAGRLGGLITQRIRKMEKEMKKEDEQRKKEA